jgi:alkylation response protein AidB-like acyl-CoA dehydrogenase
VKFTVDTELRQFTATVDELLASADVPGAARAWADGKPEPGLAIYSRLAELGLPALVVPETYGGLDAGPVALAVTVETLGYHALPGPLVETVAAVPTLLGTLGGAPAATWLPGIVAGQVLATYTAPPHLPYALDADATELRLHGDGEVVYESPAPWAGPLASIDTTRRLFDLPDGPGKPLSASLPVATATARAFEAGTLAAAAQLLGLGQSLLDTSVAHAKQRSQYGHPIGAYQAVKHLLADVATHLELARPLLHGAALALADDAGTVPRDVSAARVACADAADLAARTGLQVHGAIGYTAESDISLTLVKVRALQSAWGTQAHHRARVMTTQPPPIDALRSRPSRF